MKDMTFYGRAFGGILQGIEFFLPPSVRHRPIEYQFKGRLAVLTLMQGVFTSLGYFLAFMLATRDFHANALLSLGLSGVFLGCLFRVRAGGNFERVLGILFMLLIAWNTFYTTMITPSILLQEGMIFPMYILYCSLVCGLQWAIRVTVAAVLATIAMYYAGHAHGFRLLPGMSILQHMTSIKGVLVTLNISMLIFGIVFSLLRRMARSELRKETDWMLRGSKLREISSYASGLGHQLAPALEDLRWDLSHLRRRVDSPDIEIQRIAAMEQSVGRIMTLSRSLDWVYRNDEGPYSIQAKDLLKQMELILGAKAAAHAWDLRTGCDDENLVIHGAIPAMVLLVVTLAHRICESQIPPTYEAPLRLDVGRTGDQIYWRLTWAEDAQVSPPESDKGEILAMAEEVRGSLIQELLRTCRATLRTFVRNGQNHLVVASRIRAQDRGL